jgi:HK97 family phage major capsid protein
MHTKADQLRAQLNQKADQARELAAVENWSDDQRDLAKALADEMAKLKSDLADIAGDSTLRDALAQAGIADPANQRSTRKGTIGRQFIEHDALKSWLGQVAPNGNVPRSQHLHSPSVAIESRALLGGRKADEIVISGTEDVGAAPFVRMAYQPDVEMLGRRELTVRDLISVRQTDGNTIYYVRQIGQLNAAATVAEARGTRAGDGVGDVAGRKPWGYLEFESVTENVKTIAELVAVSEQALADAGQLRGIIDDELRDDLDEHLEDQVLSGDGTGENFVGVYNTPGVQVQEFDTDIWTSTRKALTKARKVGRVRPTAWLVSAEDDERFDLQRDGEERFYGAGPFALGPKTLWGLPRVVSEAAETGLPVLADWRKAVLWDRQQASIVATNSHADFFERNLVAIRGELRAGFGIIRPLGFILTELEAGAAD